MHQWRLTGRQRKKEFWTQTNRYRQRHAETDKLTYIGRQTNRHTHTGKHTETDRQRYKDTQTRIKGVI